MHRAPRTVAVVTAGLRQPSSTRRLAELLGRAAVEALASRSELATVEIIELRDIAHDLMDYLLTGSLSAELRRAIDTVVAADGVVAVTPIFSASYNGLFKNFFDVLDPESLVGKPVLIGATAGTPRHSLALDHAIRPLFTYLRTVVTPTAVFVATEDWDETRNQAIDDRIRRAASEFAVFVAAKERAESSTDREEALLEGVLEGR
ncbi:MAG TPA: CE1759 family FMN reductase [Acidimicrobiia bacterium]|nr:CE1759 family FMN reductase [Acidimicrobiia bacterium]